MEELLSKLGITAEGFNEDGTYIVDIPDDSTYMKYFSILDKSELVEEDNNSTLITDTVSSIQYKSEEGYHITLISDYDNDFYRLTVKK